MPPHRLPNRCASFVERGHLLLAILIAVSAAALSGCSSDPGVQEDEQTIELRQIARAYEAIMIPSGKPPNSLDQIRNALTDLHTDKLVGPPDEVLTSSRDGQPYVVILGAQLGNDTSSDILAYERRGAEGKRYVLLMSRDVRLLSDDEFKKARFTQGHKPDLS